MEARVIEFVEVLRQNGLRIGVSAGVDLTAPHAAMSRGRLPTERDGGIGCRFTIFFVLTAALPSSRAARAGLDWRSRMAWAKPAHGWW